MKNSITALLSLITLNHKCPAKPAHLIDRLSDKQVNRTTKLYLGEDYSAHSLRASFVTIAKRNGADDSKIMQQTKHRTRTMIDRYTRIQQVEEHNAAMELGL